MKKDWELNRLKQLKEEEERKAEEQDDDEMMYTYAKTEVRNTKPSKKSLKNLKKSHAKQLASSWQKSLLTSKTNTYLAETRPKRAAQGTAAPGSSSQNKACSSRLLKKAVAISCGGSGSPQKTTADKGMRKTMSRSNLIENELMKYRKQAEKLEAEAQRAMKSVVKEKQQRKVKINRMAGEMEGGQAGGDEVAANKCKWMAIKKLFFD